MIRNKRVLLIFSARDDLVKVSWKSDAGKYQNQLTPPYFDQLSERHQLLSTLATFFLGPQPFGPPSAGFESIWSDLSFS